MTVAELRKKLRFQYGYYNVVVVGDEVKCFPPRKLPAYNHTHQRIIQMRDGGMGYSEIANELKLYRQYVRQVYLYKTKGKNGLSKGGFCGRRIPGS
jgi:hypothetical protein